MDFRLIDSGWSAVLDQAASEKGESIKLICPFIKTNPIARLLHLAKPHAIHVITRFNLFDFYEGVSDTQALRLLLEHGASIKGIRNLHAKLYLFSDQRAVLTSANLTEAALKRNHEFGFVSDAPEIVDHCTEYFDRLWKKGGDELIPERLAGWERRLEKALTTGGRPKINLDLADEGVAAGFTEMPPITLPARIDVAEEAFVKFFGEGHTRVEQSVSVLEEINNSGSHWACCYPNGKRPRQVSDGAVMYLARMAHPSDYMIYGRGIAMEHKPGRDDASELDIDLRDWKENWPHYIRIHHAEFVSGTLANGISLNQLMEELGSDAFASTQRNKQAGNGNTEPRKSLQQQSSVHLTEKGHAWLKVRLEQAFVIHGRIPDDELAKLDWPANQKEDGLSDLGRRLLRSLVDYLRSDALRIDDPGTFPSYKDILLAMGITPWEHARLGPQFDREGGVDLNNWLMTNNLPAFTGLVVNKNSSLPGGDYFRSNNRTTDDFDWWMGEMERSKIKDWSEYL